MRRYRVSLFYLQGALPASVLQARLFENIKAKNFAQSASSSLVPEVCQSLKNVPHRNDRPSSIAQAVLVERKDHERCFKQHLHMLSLLAVISSSAENACTSSGTPSLFTISRNDTLLMTSSSAFRDIQSLPRGSRPLNAILVLVLVSRLQIDCRDEVVLQASRRAGTSTK